MCGIICKIESSSNSALSFKGLFNRGPDNQSQFIYKNVTLGHTRLAVINDASASNQPLHRFDYILVCNGEIYNHNDIFTHFDEVNISGSDCESIMVAYKHEGVDGFKRLKGMFSFILIDKSKDTLFVYKDRIGKKPLYYYNSGTELIFSSTIESIACNTIGNFSINRNAADFYFNNGFFPFGSNIFNEIEIVKPGELLSIHIDSLAFNSTTIVPELTSDKIYNNENFDEVINKIDLLLKNSVKRRLASLKKPTILFSGGIDSTLILEYVKELNLDVKILSIKQPMSFLNDEPFIIRYLKNNPSLRNSFKFVNLININIFKNIEDSIDHLDVPFSNSAYILLSELSKTVNVDGNVFITGDGADEIFYGYKSFDNWYSKVGENNDSIIPYPHSFSLSSWGRSISEDYLHGHGIIKVDKSSSEYSVEARSPFLDEDLVIYVRSLPISFWNSHDEVKFPLKHLLLRKGLNYNFVYRKKIGFAFPFRYLTIPLYQKIRKEILSNRDRLFQFDIVLPNNLNYFNIFTHFDYYFKIYVFLKVIKKYNNKVQW